MNCTRRVFLASLLAMGAGGGVQRVVSAPRAATLDLGFPDAPTRWHGDSSVGAVIRAGQRERLRDAFVPPVEPVLPSAGALDWAAVGVDLRRRFADLKRHFIFEYYPWYETDPWEHWNGSGRRPPVDIASNYMPRLGAYDSGSPAVIEQHARWIASAGVGAINVSWWGRDSDTDRLIPRLMDVMRDHDIHVTFHLEPYSDRHGFTYAADIMYLLKQYGERRRWDGFLLLEDAFGRVGPVFKSFRTLVTPQTTDCHGVVYPVPDYTPTEVWRQQTDWLRAELRSDFDCITLLADSLDLGRTRDAGFDGIAIYDNYVKPSSWAPVASACLGFDLAFSFNINPGFDGVGLRSWDPTSCYAPPRFEPEADTVSPQPIRAERARQLSMRRILESAETTLALQTNPQSTDARKGFFLVYINSFNEWHEGHQFEPMKDALDLTPEEQAIGYRNPRNGAYRLQYLTALLSRLWDGQADQPAGPVAKDRARQ